MLALSLLVLAMAEENLTVFTLFDGRLDDKFGVVG
jgi:hypothetical protein